MTKYEIYFYYDKKHNLIPLPIFFILVQTETLIQCWRDAGPASKTVGQYFPNTGLTRCVHQGQSQCCWGAVDAFFGICFSVSELSDSSYRYSQIYANITQICAQI